MFAKLLAFATGFTATQYMAVAALVGAFLLGGCAGCACEKHRPHIIIKTPAE